MPQGDPDLARFLGLISFPHMMGHALYDQRSGDIDGVASVNAVGPDGLELRVDERDLSHRYGRLELLEGLLVERLGTSTTA